MKSSDGNAGVLVAESDKSEDSLIRGRRSAISCMRGYRCPSTPGASASSLVSCDGRRVMTGYFVLGAPPD